MFDILQTAIQYHREGRLDQAEALYRQLLRENPRHADALHLLGVVAHQRGAHAQAIALIQEALGLNPGAAAYHTNLAEAYRATGDLARAADHCREALRLDPGSADAQNNLGLVLQKQGQTEEALALFEAAVERKPFWPMPYVNLGTLLREQGRRYEATAIYREGVRLCGDAPQLRNNLGEALLESGEVAEAFLHCQEAVRLRPDHPEALTTLGNVLCALGRLDEARTHYRRAIDLAPTLAPPFARMGLLAQAEGKLDEALSWFTEASRRDPDNSRFHCYAAGALYEQDKPDQAIERFRAGLARRADPETQNSLGYVLQDQGDVAGARAAYLEAIRLKPDYADAFLNLGLLLSETGELEEAVTALRQALRHDPNHPEALAALGLLLRDRMPAEETTAAERLLAAGRMPGKRRAVLQYGLAQVRDAHGEFARAAELARQANAYFKDEDRRHGRAFDPAEHTAYVDQIIRAYSPAHFERVRGWGVQTDLPVFVLGLPRSGTSLVEQILASHPQVFGAGELNFMRDIYRAIPAQTGMQAPGIACIDRLDRNAVQALAHRYLDRLRRLDAQAVRIVDKMPDNYLMLGLIATLFPGARIIHTRRDVRDVGLSCWLTHFRHIHWANDLEHIGVRVREYQRLMEHWRRVLPGQMIEIDYETVVADLEPVARRLVDWCGLEWDPACLDFHKTRRVVRTASMTQVREPVYRRSLGRWQHYRDVLAPFLQILGNPDRK